MQVSTDETTDETTDEGVNAPSPFAGPGAMRARCREYHWSSTQLGPVETWPQSLRTATSMVVGAAFPMVLLWGHELVQIYNDAYVPLLAGKHPADLGQPTRECWPEVWRLNAPIYAPVRAGETVCFEDARYPVSRGGPEGPVEDLYVTISYSPVSNETGRVGGVLVTFMDTPAQVLARVEAEARAATLSVVIDSIPDAVLVRGPEGITLANQAALDQLGVPTIDALRGTLAATSPLESVLLDPATGAVVPLAANPIGRALQGERSHGQFLLRALGGARAADAAEVPVPRPARASAAPIVGPAGAIIGAVTVLTDMTRTRAAEAERERLLAVLDGERTLLRTVLDQMPAAIFIVEAPSGRVLALNDEVARVWGERRPLTGAVGHYDKEWVGHHLDGRRVASEEWPVARAVLAGETVTDWVGEIERPDGTRVTSEVSVAPVHDAQGRTVAAVAVAAVAVAADITARAQAARERERLLHELELERARLAYVFQQAPAFLAALRGPTYVFTLVNDAYYQLVGHRELVGKAVWDALPEVRGQGFEERLAGVVATGEPFPGREVSITVARTPGASPEERFIDLTYMPLVEPDGTRAGVIAHGTDVSEHVLARREIERLLAESERARVDAETARAEAQGANEAKAQFLAVMSHELRTPLNAISGYVELIELGIRGPVTAQQREDLARIQKSQRHLLGLISGVLNYSRAEAGAVHYEVDDVPLDTVLATCETLIAPQARAKQITLHFAACHEALTVRADREKLQQIVVNLLSNAVKFTAAGGTVTLACALDHRPGDEASVVVTVSDTGRGIAPDALERVFEPFVQVDTRLTRTEEGIGLGLAISRDLARGMAGDLVERHGDGARNAATRLVRAGRPHAYQAVPRGAERGRAGRAGAPHQPGLGSGPNDSSCTHPARRRR